MLYFHAADWIHGSRLIALRRMLVVDSTYCTSPWVGFFFQPVTSTVKFIREVVPTLTRKVASNDRDWRPDLSILATATFDQNQITIHNVRNCRYRTEEDYDLRHYDLHFDLPDVRSVDFIIVPFSDKPLLAHTMLSFGLADGQYFSVSVEGRLEQGEDYSLRGEHRTV